MFDSVDECQRACPNAFPPEIDVITKVKPGLDLTITKYSARG
jgi:hypothetical protein